MMRDKRAAARRIRRMIDVLVEEATRADLDAVAVPLRLAGSVAEEVAGERWLEALEPRGLA